jgi:hypothetical protein
MFNWLEDNNAAWNTYFNFDAPDGNHQIYPDSANVFPNARVKYQTLFD